MKKYIEKTNYGFIVIIIGSIIGFIIENVRTCILKDHCILRQGLIYGPFIPVYGAGLLVLYIIYNKQILQSKNVYLRLLISFVLGFFLGTIVEYIFSIAQEAFFGTTSWDYHYLKYNFQGRISLKHASMWGLLGMVFSFTLLPLMNRLRDKMYKKNIQIIASIISVLFIIDISISWIACVRAAERRNNIHCNNIVDKFCDKYYPDSYLDKIFTNAKVKE